MRPAVRCSTRDFLRSIGYIVLEAGNGRIRWIICTHTHFDHSPAFHALLAQLFEGDVKAADAWLKAYGRSLYSAFG